MYEENNVLLAGKTLMLILQGLRWLREGRFVHVLSNTGPVPQPSATQIAHQLRSTMMASSNEATSAVKMRQLNPAIEEEAEVTRAVKELTKFAKARGDQLYILMDEVVFDLR
jgi:hypothetical protein